MTGLFTVARDELRRILSTPPVFSTFIVAVLLYAVFYPQPYLNEALRDVPIVIVDQDHTQTSRDLARQVDAAEPVAIVADAPDLVTAERLVFARQASGILVIPQYFERDLLHGRPSPLAVYSDASYFLIHSRVANGVSGVARIFGAGVEANRLVAAGVDPANAAAATDPMPLTAIPLFNPQAGYATYILPAAFVLILQQTLLIGVGLLGTLPGNRHGEGFSPVTFVIGRQFSYLTVEVFSFSLYLVALPYLYGIPRLGHIETIAALALPFVLAVAGLGMCVARLVEHPARVQLLLGGVGLPFLFMTGFSWPLEAIPEPVRILSSVVPTSFAIDGIVRAAQMGASLAEVRHQFVALWVQAGAYTSLAILLEWVRRRETSKASDQTAVAN